MAGRVERRINDKFYFILDEVDGSSDCESELTDNDGKLARSLIQKNITRDENDSNLQKNTSGATQPDVQIINYDKNISEDICISEKNEAFPKICIISDSKPKSPPKFKENVVDNTLSDAVDMEIDSDVEVLDQKQEPILKVTFRDSEIKKRLKSSILKFFSQKFNDCAVISNSENDLEIEVYDKGSKGFLEDDLLDFNLDTTPGENNLEIPNYGRAHDLILSDKNIKHSQSTEKQSTYCFNCMGDHNLRDCKLKKDFTTINKNRILFQSKPQKERPPKVSRYHLDEYQKFSHLAPGSISKKLRNALNLRRDQQPEFIYRMRLLGYPPAWLEEAKVSHSGVAMYDDMGMPVLDEDEEEGEILPQGSKDRFDITKIIEFPGFNVPLPSNFRDETKFYKCPTLSEEQSKESLINILKPKTVQAYVKKPLTSQKSHEKSGADEKGDSSPTIEEMEEKKRQLLMELSNEESVSEPKSNFEDLPLEETPSKESPCSKELGTVKNLEFGTPVLKSVSPFAKLPSREQFSCNINDVIPFENLPNSTGKYETIRHVISKIRTTSKSRTSNN